jgi:hypothetical protein
MSGLDGHGVSRNPHRRQHLKSQRMTAVRQDNVLSEKKATERAAQREHRKRQKKYVHELEAQLKLVKARHGSESLALLMKENEQL